MIHFLTERDDHPTTVQRCTREDILNYCMGKEFLGYDCEFNKLDPYLATLLIVVVGDEKEQFAIDATSVDLSFLQPLAKDNYTTFIGHNIKIDYKMSKVNGFIFKKVWDTMIAEQRIGLGSGRRNGLDAVLLRRLGVLVSKDVREEFIHMDKKSVFYNRHIEYSCDDVAYLKPLVDIQMELIKKFKMEFLHFGIEFPLISIMGDCDLEGFVLDQNKWGQIIAQNKIEKARKVLEMDEEVKACIIAYSPELANGKYTRKRNLQTYEQASLFGPPKIIEHESSGNLKYTSPAQMKQLFHDLGETPPMNKDKETVGVDQLEQYLLEKPESIMATFLRIYIEHSKINKQLSTYGEAFLKRINPITRRLHTVFRHCSTDTGRFSSGDAKAGYPNLQNIPADNKFRHCFGVEEGYEVTTCDLSGAELIVMVALSGDLKLLELSSGDMHSHMANICWEKIFKRRQVKWTDKHVISKEQNKKKRNDFKPMTFGTIYGMHKKKAASQLGIAIEEGQIVVDTIRQEIPDVFKMVEEAGKFALDNGYVIHNTRTNSRRWFTPVLEARKALKEMQAFSPLDRVPDINFYLEYRNAKPQHLMRFLDKIECESAARNTKIQGTQADMVKEAIVEIAQIVERNNWDVKLLATVHDELVYKHPVNYHVFCPYAEKEVHVSEFIKIAMKTVSNRYLNGVVEMGAEAETMKTWTK